MKQYYISIGETGAMFTLRMSYISYGRLRSRHIQNLSNDADMAYDKAMIVSVTNDIPLQTSRDDLDVQLREIRRRSSAEVKQEAHDRELQAKHNRELYFKSLREQLEKGIMPLGIYEGKSFDDIPRSYLEWCTDIEFEHGSPMAIIAEDVFKHIENDPLPVPNVKSIVGKPKQRLWFNVTVIKIASFTKHNTYSRVSEEMFVTTMVDSSGNCLVCFSVTFGRNLVVGETLRIKATVKEHTVYGDQAQTIIQRVKVLD